MTVPAPPSTASPGRLTTAQAYEIEADAYYRMAAEAVDADDEPEAGRLFALHRRALQRARNLAPRPTD